MHAIWPSLRVIGFTKGEVAFVLLGELAVVTLVALPAGRVAGICTCPSASQPGFPPTFIRSRPIFDPASYGQAMLVVLGAAVVSGWLVKRDLDRADLVEALKTRE